MTIFRKTIDILEKEKRIWDKAIKDWNNKKLNEEIRHKSEKFIDTQTEKGRGEIEIEAQLSLAKQLQKQVEDVLDKLPSYNVTEEDGVIKDNNNDGMFINNLEFKKKLEEI